MHPLNRQKLSSFPLCSVNCVSKSFGYPAYCDGSDDLGSQQQKTMFAFKLDGVWKSREKNCGGGGGDVIRQILMSRSL